MVGNNGVGKSTLLDLITGKLQPQKGTIKISDSASIGYFNQRGELGDLNKNVANFVGEGKDYISIEGKRSTRCRLSKRIFVFRKKSFNSNAVSLRGREE